MTLGKFIETALKTRADMSTGIVIHHVDGVQDLEFRGVEYNSWYNAITIEVSGALDADGD
jgi:hypothetical protein